MTPDKRRPIINGLAISLGNVTKEYFIIFWNTETSLWLQHESLQGAFISSFSSQNKD